MNREIPRNRAAIDENGRTFRGQLRRQFDEIVNSGFVERLRAKEMIDSGRLSRLGALGLFGIGIPESHGGQGGGLFELGVALEQVGRLSDDDALGQAISANWQVADLLLASKRDRLIEQYVRQLAQGKAVAVLVLNEDCDGTKGKLTARRVESGYVVNGTKRAVVGLARADCVAVWAEGSSESSELGLVVDAKTPGVRIACDRGSGWHTSGIGTLTIENSQVPMAQLITEAPPRQRYVNTRNILESCQLIGVMQRALDRAVEIVSKKERHGSLLAEFVNVQAAMGHVYAELETCRAIVYHALEGLAKDGSTGEFDAQSAIARRHCNTTIGMVAVSLTETIGSEAFFTEWGLSHRIPNAVSMAVVRGGSPATDIDIGIHAISDYQIRKQEGDGL